MSKNKLKVGFLGDGPWALNTLKEILRCEHFTVPFVTVRFQNPDLQVVEYCKTHNLKLIEFENINSLESIEAIKSYNLDIILSVSYDQIFKKQIIDIPQKGIINFHAGALPFYRGRNVINWALINGEKNLGLTVHYIDELIDTGDIILQKFIPIKPHYTYASLMKEAADAAPSIILNAINQIRTNSVKAIKQSSIHPVGSYFCKRRPGDELINWNWDSLRIYNFIRGISYPAPCARTYFQGKEIKLISAKILENAIQYIATPGEILKVNSDGTFVKTGDSLILIDEISDIDGNPLKLKVGDRFQQ